MLAGRDGSRALAKMSLDKSDVRDEWDDLSDLTPFQRDSLSEWEMKFQTRYAEVGAVIKSFCVSSPVTLSTFYCSNFVTNSWKSASILNKS